ncbi:MAG: hypothetical protein HRU11_02820 [Parvularculaceae bacterium]|nr:hypothetical protein [Parvularculaceae bacterium]
MTDYQYAVVLIIPDAHKAAFEALGQQLGHSGHEYSIPLSASGQEPVTHWGLNTLTTQAFVNVLSGQVPDGVDSQVFQQLSSLQIVSIKPSSDYRGHFAEVLLAEGLQSVIPPDQDLET